MRMETNDKPKGPVVDSKVDVVRAFENVEDVKKSHTQLFRKQVERKNHFYINDHFVPE